MKQYFVLFLLSSVCVFTGCDKDNNLVGSGNLTTQTRGAVDFTEIASSESVEVEVIRGDDFLVEVTADDNIIDRVQTEQRGNELRISMENGSYRRITARVSITMPVIERISGSTSSELTFQNFNQPAGELDVNMKTSSKLTMENSTVRKLNVDMATSSKADCFGLATQETEVTMATSSDLEISVADELTGSANTSSEVTYRGNPSVEVSVETSASVRRAN